MNVFVSGSLAYDRIMDFPGRFSDHILPNKIHNLNVSFLVETFRQSFGGTAGNIAYNLALLGEQPIVLGSYGKDFTEYAAWCKRHSINIIHCQKVKDEITASAYIITDQRDNQITGFYPGAMKYSCGPLSKKVLAKTALGVIAPGNLVDMKKMPVEFKKYGISYLYDPGQQITSLTKSDILKGLHGSLGLISNDYELALIQKKTGLTLRQLCKLTYLVITTLGAKGSRIHCDKKIYKIPPAKPANTSDPTGAGDAYRAGFIKGLLEGYDLAKVGRLASVVSLYTVEKYGTQTHKFSWPDIKQRYKRNYRQSL
ncbi:carbohydrate kinase family protein [Patescibacteria group bacterium]|nr:carbohydrate kinase family protein [Patescibacteria group bacterium]